MAERSCSVIAERFLSSDLLGLFAVEAEVLEQWIFDGKYVSECRDDSTRIAILYGCCVQLPRTS
jgi:hypothetical protein